MTEIQEPPNTGPAPRVRPGTHSGSEQLSAEVVPTPIGPLTVVVSDRGVRAVLWPGDDPGRVPLATATGPTDHPLLRQAVVELGEYFAGERTAFDVPLDPVGTDFQLAAWSVLRSIPYGETISYAQQADALGDRNKARAVGAANGRNPVSVIVPCHRVVATSGVLTGFAGGLEAKSWLLAHERHRRSG